MNALDEMQLLHWHVYRKSEWCSIEFSGPSWICGTIHYQKSLSTSGHRVPFYTRPEAVEILTQMEKGTGQW